MNKIVSGLSILLSLVADWLAGLSVRPVWHRLPKRVHQLYLQKLAVAEVFHERDLPALKLCDSTVFFGPADAAAYMCPVKIVRTVRPYLQKRVRGEVGDAHAALAHNLIMRAWAEFSSYPYVADRTFNLRAGDTFVDIGAFRGYVAVRAAQRVGETGRVYAIEPIIENFEFLSLHKQVNALTQLEVIRSSVSVKEADEISFYRVANQENSEVPEHLKGAGVVTVPNTSTKRLADRVLANKPRRVIVSLTTNGTEFELAQSLMQILQGCVEYFEITLPFIYTGSRLQQELVTLNGIAGVTIIVSYPWLTICYSRIGA